MKKKVLVLGATGNVGRQIFSILFERNFPIHEIYAVASDESIGKEINFGKKIIKVDSIKCFNFHDIDIVFSAISEKLAKNIIPKIVECGCVVIDKSSYFRLDPNVPLVVPEVNINTISLFKKKNIISSPNCCAIPLSVVLKPLNNLCKIKRIIISTYQSTSGAGYLAMEELFSQITDFMSYQDLRVNVFPKKIAFNVIPQIDCFLDNGYTAEEEKISKEIQKILNDNIPINVTAVRVPLFIGHSATVNVEFENFLDIYEVEKCLSDAKGLVLIKHNDKKKYITPNEAVGSDNVFISRLRKDYSCNNAISFWLTVDNLRKGAALNAVQIAEELIDKYL